MVKEQASINAATRETMSAMTMHKKLRKREKISREAVASQPIPPTWEDILTGGA